MAWSFTRASINTGEVQQAVQITWFNHWSVTQEDAITPGTLRFTVSVVTDSYYAVTASGRPYPFPYLSTDQVSFNGTSVAIHQETAASPDYSYTVTIEVPDTWAGQTVTFNLCNRSDYVTLPAAAPADLYSTISANNGTLGVTLPITLSTRYPDVRHYLRVKPAYDPQDDGILLLDNSSATVAWWQTAVMDYADDLPANSGSLSFILMCTTYAANGSLLGSDQKTITMSLPAGALPPSVSDGWATAQVLNEGDAVGLQSWIQGISKAQVVFDSSKISPQYGATISGYAIRCGGVEDIQSPYTTPVLSGATAQIVCTVIDSRGQEASETLTVTLLPYSGPVITGDSAFRSDSTGDADEAGTYITAQASVTISSLGGENSGTLKLYTRRVGASAWTYEQVMTAGMPIAPLGGFSADQSYEVKIELTDRLGRQDVKTYSIASQKWAMKFRPTGNGVAFGKAAEADRELQLPGDWLIRIGQRTLLDLFYPVGSLFWSAQSTNPGSIMGGTWTAVEDVFILAAGPNHQAGSTGGAETVTLTLSEIPAHDHGSGSGNKAGNIGYVDTGGTENAFQTTFGPVSARTDLNIHVEENGGGQAHQNMPPYKAYYCWERTA